MTRKIGICILGAGLLVPGTAWETAIHGQQSVSHALLIGVTNYPHLEKRFQLLGPANDIALVRETLTGAPFNVDPLRIVQLVEPPAGTVKIPSPGIRPERPTRAKIEQEFRRLSKTVNKGDQVFIFFSGHGSQQPDESGDEIDGLDEIFLPADVDKWKGDIGAVPNALTDDDIGEWLKEIRNTGAFVWVMFDACQSTTMTRGAEIEVQRFVPPGVLGIPSRTVKRETRMTSVGRAKNEILDLAESAGIAALYAAQTTESTPEKPMPDGPLKTKRSVHGLFTYTLMTVLQQATGRLTYRDLLERVVQQYRAMGRSSPTPGFEGGGLDREVLGLKDFSRTARLRLGDVSGNHIEIRAGAVHGLTPGSILRVYSGGTAVDSGAPIGHLKLVEVDAMSSTAEPIAYDSMPKPALRQLARGGYGQAVFYDYTNNVFKVALYPNTEANLNADIVTHLEQALDQLAKETDGRVERTDSLTEATWLVRITDAGDVVLAPASGWRADNAVSDVNVQATVLVARSGSKLVAKHLAGVLEALTRANTLMKLAVAYPGRHDDVNVHIELLRYGSGQNDEIPSPVPAENGTRTLYIGDHVAFGFRNTGRTAIDITLLLIDADYGIEVLYPVADQEADARLLAGEERRTERIVVAAPTGWEQVIAVAVEASPLRQDFRALEQPALKRTAEAHRSASSRGKSFPVLPDSPLGRLLKGVIQGVGTTRGIKSGDVGRYSLKMLTWRTEEARNRKE